MAEKLIKGERKMSAKNVLLALLITGVIFAIGLLVGSSITADKVDDILTLEREARLQLESLDLEEKLLQATPCANPESLSRQLNELGVKLIFLESQYEKGDSRITDLKKPYTILEVKHYLKLRDMVEKCDNDYTMVLFFYSNEPDMIGASEEQGFVLDYLQKKYSTKRVKIYSFDTDLDLDLVNTMKRIYGIKTVPSMVISDKLFVGFHDKEELEELIESGL
ncbi:hypothetical protein ACFLZZ_04230 [Nanoarchaeota archaeon]